MTFDYSNLNIEQMQNLLEFVSYLLMIAVCLLSFIFSCFLTYLGFLLFDFISQKSQKNKFKKIELEKSKFIVSVEQAQNQFISMFSPRAGAQRDGKGA